MVLITGGTGFIGSSLVDHFTDTGVELRLLSRKKVAGCETVVCDLQSELINGDALNGIHTVLHLAAFAGDLRNVTDIDRLYRTFNVDVTVRLAELAATSGVQRFVYVSSVRAGGRAVPGKSMTESDQGEPEGVYGQTKREAELKVLEIGQKSGMHVSVVRPSLVYGPGVKGNLRKMLSAVERGWLPQMPETRNCRSMVHVDDLVTAILLVAKAESTNGEIFIVTDGVDYSTREIYDAIRSTLGKRPMAVTVPKTLFAVAAWLGDHTGGRFAFDSYMLQKLFENEWYSSNKLRGMGFEPRHTLQSAMPSIIASRF